MADAVLTARLIGVSRLKIYNCCIIQRFSFLKVCICWAVSLHNLPCADLQRLDFGIPEYLEGFLGSNGDRNVARR